MRFHLFPKMGAFISQSQRRSWIEISILIVLAAAILRLGGDLASQWRLSGERVSSVEADLHAKSKADYSVDPLDAVIPPISPAILEDLFGLISPPWETPADASGENQDVPPSPGVETPVVTVATPTPTPTLHVPEQTDLPPDPVTPTGTLLAASLTPTPTSSQSGLASATPTRTIMASPTPTRSLTPWISPTRTPTQAISPTRTPTQVTDPTLTPTTVIKPTKTPSPTNAPSKTPTRTSQPTVPSTVTPVPDTPTPVPDTPTPIPNTSTPAPKTSTPFVTRDPTRALTPTGNYTPGGTSVPFTVEPPGLAAVELSNCEPVANQPQVENSCPVETSGIERSMKHNLWQALLDVFGLDFRSGVNIWVAGQ